MRSYRYRIIAVALLLMMAVSGAQAGGFNATIGQLAWSPDGQSLVYPVNKEGVFVVTPDGEPRRILDAKSVDWVPQWSPDGKYIVSTIEVDNQAGIFRTPLTGGAPERLTEDVGWRPKYYAPNGMQPRYSPDGESIAFLSLREGDTYMSLYSMTAAGDDEHALTQAGTVYDFVWSPDGQAIAFMATPDDYSGPSDLFLVDTFGTKLRRLTTTSDLDTRYLPAWTPDGKHILFTANTDDNRGRIDIIDMDGQNRKVFREQAAEPVYSPDGKYILFTSPAERWFNLSIMNADNREPDAVTITLPGERAYYAAAWSPDSGHIAFVARRFDAPESEDIVIVNADGSDPQIVVTLPMS